MNILQALDMIPDFRVTGRCKHRLGHVLGIALVAILHGACSYRQMAAFGRSRLDWLRDNFFEGLRAIPSHDVFRNVFVGMDPDLFCGLFALWAQGLREQTGQKRLVCLDGKGLRGAARPDGTIPFVVSAWLETERLVLGQVAVEAKSNETKAYPELFKKLIQRGCIVSIDAAGCQKNLARELVEVRGADYLFALKGNQGNTLCDVKLLMEDLLANEPQRLCRHEEWNKEHGRIERRTCYTTNWVDWDPLQGQWTGLKTLCMIESERRVGTAAPTVERRFYLSSLEADAETMQRPVRGHWGIEDRLHYVKDVDFGEDRCRARTGHSAMNRSTMLHVALNLINRSRPADVGVKAHWQMIGWDLELAVRTVKAA